ncbi:unnamed protein product [Merluccius merluccius]
MISSVEKSTESQQEVHCLEISVLRTRVRTRVRTIGPPGFHIKAGTSGSSMKSSAKGFSVAAAAGLLVIPSSRGPRPAPRGTMLCQIHH